MTCRSPSSEFPWWLALHRVAGVGPRLFGRVLERFGGPRPFLEAGEAEWRSVGATERVVEGLREPDWAGVEEDLRWLEGEGRRLLTLADPDYPALLREIPDPPALLFVTGDPALLGTWQLAVIGSRNPTRGGRQSAEAFAAHLAGAGLAITSGLATGVDAAAHRGALEGGGKTVAVCATGPDRVYPARNRALAEEIAQRGALVTEYPVGVAPRAAHFPRRNRIISGLSLGVLVVEAAVASGSLITARLAAEQGREVFAIPGSIHNPLSRGCHRLIREGAKLVERAEEILVELAPLALAGVEGQASAEEVATPFSIEEDADGEYARLLECLGHDPQPVDRLVECSGLTPEEVSSMLLILELRGLVASNPGGTYSRLPNQRYR